MLVADLSTMLKSYIQKDDVISDNHGPNSIHELFRPTRHM
jgi:hypothetical protein